MVGRLGVLGSVQPRKSVRKLDGIKSSRRSRRVTNLYALGYSLLFNAKVERDRCVVFLQTLRQHLTIHILPVRYIRGVIVDQWENMARFQVYVAVSDQVPVGS
jgi:hypothetical protein